jgi:endonuclease/exonuclease/phosphatase family metal-dependent hydrolase
MSTMRVASYNLKDFTLDQHAAARIVRAIDPDVLCLQEVPRRLFAPWRVSMFAAECGMYWSGKHRGSGGTTIFTSLRVQVAESRHYRLRVAALQRTRGYAVLRVGPPGREPVVVASVHLSLDADERAVHAGQILRTLTRAGVAGGAAGPVLLAGDLNEGETGRAWQAFASPLRLVSPTTPTYPAKAPRKALDVIFASPGLTVLPHQAVDLPTEDLVAASDHRPTWVDLELDPAAVPTAEVETGPAVAEATVAEAEAKAEETVDAPAEPPADAAAARPTDAGTAPTRR